MILDWIIQNKQIIPSFIPFGKGYRINDHCPPWLIVEGLATILNNLSLLSPHIFVRCLLDLRPSPMILVIGHGEIFHFLTPFLFKIITFTSGLVSQTNLVHRVNMQTMIIPASMLVPCQAAESGNSVRQQKTGFNSQYLNPDHLPGRVWNAPSEMKCRMILFDLLV